MKNTKRITSMVLTLVMLIFALSPVAAFAAPDLGVGYSITGRENGGDFILDVAAYGVSAYGGRLAIAFDSDKLQLKDTSSLRNAMEYNRSIVLTTEGLDTSLLLSNQKGCAMFAWYSSSNSGFDVSDGVNLVSIPFEFKNGASVDDFSRNTIGLYYVNGTMANNWSSSAELISTDLVAYRNTSIDDSLLCGVSFDYPNCDYVPPTIYKAGVTVGDENGKAVSGAEVTLGGVSETTNSAGYAEFEMENGVYPYRVTADGYITKSGYVIVDGDTSASVEIESITRFVRNLAANLTIDFAGGDDADSVTASVGLPTSGEYGETISWQSSKPDVMSDIGTVSRQFDDTNVTLTATVSYGGAAAKRTFDLTVKSRYTAEERNSLIVQSDFDALEIGFAPGDSANAVTAGLTLPAAGANGSTIAWESSNEDVISAFGYLERPEDDADIKLTAVIMRGTVQKTKEFNVKVIGTKQASTVSDTDIVERVKNALEIGYAAGNSASRVTASVTLPTVGVDGTEITWTSSHPAVVTAYGGVIRQVNDTDVTLTALIKHGEATAEKTFNIRVAAAYLIPVNPDNGQENDINKTNNDRSPSSSAADTNIEMVDPDTISAGNQNQGTNGENTGFTDIASVPWAREAILALSEKGVIKGTSAVTFSPDEPIMRCDFVTLLVRMIGLSGEVSNADTFSDVAEGEYYYEPVTLAKSHGLITGVGDNMFDPTGYITRQDMMTMTYRALTALNKADLTAADLSGFADNADVADYAAESVAKMVGAGYIKGDAEGLLNPNSNTTRAETAVFLYRLQF